MTAHNLDIREPEVDPETTEYWAAANRRELLLGHCSSCATHHHYPRHHCPFCGSTDIAFVGASGRGTIYSVSTLRRTETPYMLAWVVLPEGPGLMTNIIGCAPGDAEIGDAVEIDYLPAPSGQLVPMARVVGAKDE